MKYLVLSQEKIELMRTELKKGRTTIGRASDNDVYLVDPSLALHQAEIIEEDGRYFISNLETQNPLYLKGKKVKKAEVKVGDVFKIGKIEFQLEEKKTEMPSTKISRLKSLLEITNRLTGVYQLSSLLERILKEALKFIEAERGVVLLTTLAGKLEAKATVGIKLPIEKNLSLSSTLIKRVLKEKKIISISDLENDSELKEAKSIIAHRISSIVCLPLKNFRGDFLGILYLDRKLKKFSLREEDLELLAGFANQCTLAIQQVSLFEQEKRRYEERIKNLKQENLTLRTSLQEYQFEDIIYRCSAMEKVIDQLKKVAPSSLEVLIEGETGTGKELVARALHRQSTRKNQAFIAINCAAIPESLLESELFGFERGSFTGAVVERKGKFELANGGTIFLDEIGEMPLSLQVKLLRVLQEGEIEKIGRTKAVKVDLRIIAATSKNLEKEVEQGRFREDLYYRLAVFKISLPPLKEREDDVILLAQHFLRKYGAERKKLSPATKEAIKKYPWPGNIRELENKIKKATILAEGEFLEPADLELPPLSPPLKTLKEKKQEIEEKYLRPYLEYVLNLYQGNISLSAKALDIDWKTMRDLKEKYSLGKG